MISIARTTQGYKVRYRDQVNGGFHIEPFSDLVIATGRFGGTALEQLISTPQVALQEQRYELGIRLEHPNGKGFLGKIKHSDVKLILDRDGLQTRTFCTCRNGEVWHIPYQAGSALSGRSDGPRTGYSNFGLLPRFAGARRDQGRAIWRHFKAHSAIHGWHSGSRCRNSWAARRWGRPPTPGPTGRGFRAITSSADRSTS